MIMDIDISILILFIPLTTWESVTMFNKTFKNTGVLNILLITISTLEAWL